jgi:putative endonuclease
MRWQAVVSQLHLVCKAHQHPRIAMHKAAAMTEPRQPAVYILANRRHGTLYTGVTSDLVARTWLHRQDAVEGFSRQYQTHRLVWFERHATMDAAITREKRIKKWYRSWKVRLIEESNPMWMDLWPQLIGENVVFAPTAGEQPSQ